MSANDIDGYNSSDITCEKKENYVTIERSRSLRSSCSTSKYETLAHVRVRISRSSDEANEQPIKCMNENGKRSTIDALDHSSIKRFSISESKISKRNRSGIHNSWKCGSKVFLKNEKVKMDLLNIC